MDIIALSAPSGITQLACICTSGCVDIGKARSNKNKSRDRNTPDVCEVDTYDPCYDEDPYDAGRGGRRTARKNAGI